MVPAISLNSQTFQYRGPVRLNLIYSNLYSCQWISTQREKGPHSQFFWSMFLRIQTEYGEIRSIWMRRNTDQKNFQNRHFSCIGSKDKKSPKFCGFGFICIYFKYFKPPNLKGVTSIGYNNFVQVLASWRPTIFVHDSERIENWMPL